MIGIIDYGMGNLGSVANALAYLQAPACILSRPGDLHKCRALVLPGVGAFGDCLRNLQTNGYWEPVREWLQNDRPFLGLCLGLQILCAASEESPGVAGLGLIPSTVVRFQPAADRKVPQIGWNRVRLLPERPCPLMAGIPDGTYFYFVHSYYLPAAPGWAAGWTDYGGEYVSVVWRSRCFAVQFHPEKSQQAGLQLLRNFLKISAEGHE